MSQKFVPAWNSSQWCVKMVLTFTSDGGYGINGTISSMFARRWMGPPQKFIPLDSHGNWLTAEFLL
jgi:hypothetical protein